MHTLSRPLARLASTLALAALASTALSGCYPDNPHQLAHTLVVHGVVTDSGSGQPLANVKVTLLSLDNFAPRITDAQGYFQFTDVLQQDNLLVQFQLAGYQTLTVTVNPTVVVDGGVVDAGIASFPGFNNADGFAVNVALSQVLTVTVAGIIYSGPTLAAGAQVAITTLTGTPIFSATAASDGSFSFANVPVGNYNLIVMPWDRDNDGATDTQFYTQALNVTPGGPNDLGHLAINLADVQKTLVASSFAGLTYPVTIQQLLAGVSGVLQQASGMLFLTFGAEVDPTETSFELVQFEAGGTRFSAPIPLTVTWSHGAIAQITPGSTLQTSDATNVGYQLRIRALRFADGTVSIAASPSVYGMINFAVQAQPAQLTNPTPSVYLANQLTATQTATKAVFDANTVWLLDANGDFVFDTVAAANWSSGNPIQLQWPSVPGAVSYHLYLRNTTSPGDGATGTLDWQEQTNVSIEANDPNQTQTIVATNVSPWSLSLGYAVGPWAFGNHVQFAVAAQDALGFITPIDASKVLDTADTFGGLLTGAAFDPGGNAPFATTTELGATFDKTVKLSFSEPMLATAVPTVTGTSARAKVKKVLASGWSNGGAPGAPLDSATSAFLALQLTVPGNCTEVTVPRAAGDNLIVVRDASYFTQGAASVVVFLSPAGQFLLEADGIGQVDTTANQLTLAAPLVTGANIPQGGYACSTQNGAATAVPSVSGSTLTVGDASKFAVGDAALYYEPQGTAAPIADLVHISGVDTSLKTIVLSAAPSAGHTAASVLFPVPPFGAEQSLRVSQQLTLLHDVPGGAGAQLSFAGPITGVAVGDKLLVDADGDLKTTLDQAQVTVTALGFAPTGTPAVYTITADLPSTLTLLHGKAKVAFLGDSFTVGTTSDTSGNMTLDPHRDQLTPDGFLY